MGNIQSEPQEPAVLPPNQSSSSRPNASSQNPNSPSTNPPAGFKQSPKTSSSQLAPHGATDSLRGSQLNTRAPPPAPSHPSNGGAAPPPRRANLEPVYIAQKTDERYGEIKIMQYPDTKQMLAVKSTTYQDSADYEQLVKLCQDYKTKNISNIISVIDYKVQPDEGLCSSMYLVTITYQYLDHDLKRDIEERRASKNYYREDELYTLIGNVAEGISSLLQMGGVHGDIQPKMILMSKDSAPVFKLTDIQFMTNNGSAFQKIILNHYGPESCYLSKELFEALRYQQLNPQHDPVQNDVFSLGLSVLHAALLEDVQKVYNFANFTFNKGELDSMLKRVGERYSPQFVTLLRQMLEVYLNERIGIDGILTQCAQSQKNSVIQPQPVIKSPEKQQSELRNSMRESVRPGNHSPQRNSFLNPASATYQPSRHPGQSSAQQELETENSPIKRLDGSIIQNEKTSPDRALFNNNNNFSNNNNNNNNNNHINESYLKNSQHTSPNSQRHGESSHQAALEPYNNNHNNYTNNTNMERSLIEIDQRVREALNLSQETQQQYELSPVQRFREELLSDQVYVPLNTSADAREQQNISSIYKNNTSYRPLRSNLSSQMGNYPSNQSVSQKPWVQY